MLAMITATLIGALVRLNILGVLGEQIGLIMFVVHVEILDIV
jgi:hypothetical protein